MKVSICTRGGGGKSSIANVLANHVRTRRISVLAVDSDESNSGLSRIFGFDQPPSPLMELAGNGMGFWKTCLPSSL